MTSLYASHRNPEGETVCKPRFGAALLRSLQSPDLRDLLANLIASFKNLPNLFASSVHQMTRVDHIFNPFPVIDRS